MIRYIAWKYWHTPFLHGLTAAVVTDYDMHTEYVEGKICPTWFIPEKRMTWRKFRLRLSAQQLAYTPKKCLFPGDNNFLCMDGTTKQKATEDSFPVVGGHLKSLHARTRVDWWFVRYSRLPGGHDGEGPGLVVIIIIIIDRDARGRGGPEAVAAGTAAVAMAAAMTVAATVAAV